MRSSLVRRSCLALAVLSAASLASATIFTVTTTSDSGVGSLRAAVVSANAVPGPHTIAFSIPGSGPHSIALATDLPTIVISGGLTIDGTTQPGYTNAPLIEIHRDDTNATCLNFAFTPATVKALAINRCGIAINNSNGGGLTLLGSRIGTDPSGTVVLANASSGIYLGNGAANVIGGPGATERNVVSGNGGPGIQLGFGSTGTIRGNRIGVDLTGTVAIPNAVGISCSNATGLIVGGSGAGQGNVISSSAGPGLLLQSCLDAVVQGNFIGTDVTGTAPLPNNRGIEANLATNVKIGGTSPGEGNVISGNVGEGVRLTAAADATVQGNFIGTDATGALELGNSVGADLNSSGTLFGTAAPGGPGGNVVAFNAVGVKVTSFPGNTIRGNSIHDNRFLGIDLGGNSVTANDAGDSDTDQQNFPIISSAVPEGAGVRVIGTLDTTASATFDLDFYENPACSRFPQDFLEGPTWIGATQVTTDGSGHAAFNVLLSPVTVATDLRVTSTATDAGGSTSEFSQRLVFSSAGLTGSPTGGSFLLIQGMQFEPGATVTVGGVPATNVQWQSQYVIQASSPALPPGSINNLVVTNPSGLSGTLPNAYVSLFSDVDPGSLFRPFIGGLVANGLTVGCGGPNYCPLSPVTRQQMAVFLLRGKLGLCYTPPPCTGLVFDDVPCAGNSFAPWVEALAGYNITGGCGGNNFCPTAAVNRQQMAVFLLKALEGSDYVPPPCTTATFDDVPCSNPFAPWIYELAARAITGGCGGNSYCPTGDALRQQMAVFLVKTFTLPY